MALMMIFKNLLSMWLFHGTLSLPFRNWTLHNVARNWNDASAICNALGGKLATPMSGQDREVFRYFLSRSPWSSNIGSSGLVWAARNPTTDEIVWNDCSDPFNTWSPTTFFMDFNCASISFLKTMATIDCNLDSRSYFCEHIVQETCPYTEASGQVPSDVTPFWRSYSPLTSLCQATCDGLDDCWAYSYDSLIKECILYEAPHALYFEDGSHLQAVASADINTFYKTCFVDDLDTDEYLVSVSPSMDAIDFQCGVAEPNATVYTVYASPLTYDEAILSCTSRGQTIAIIDTEYEYYVVQTLVNNSTLTFHWVGYREDAFDGRSYWTNGQAALNVNEEYPSLSAVACGTLHLNTGEYKLHDCTTALPYVCQETKGQCGFHIREGLGSSGFTSQGTMKTDQCKSQCLSNMDCFAFDHQTGYSPFLPTCYTRTANGWLDTFTPGFVADYVTADTDRFLARWTCIWVVQISLVQETSSSQSTSSEVISQNVTSSTDIITSDTPSTESVISVLVTDNTDLPTTDLTASTISGSTNNDVHSTQSVVLETSVVSSFSDLVTTNVDFSTTALPETTNDNTLPSESISSSHSAMLSTAIYSNGITTYSTSSSTASETSTYSTTSTDPTYTSDSKQINYGRSSFSALILCPCACPENMTVPSNKELSQFDDLIVPVKSTSAYRRRMASAKDSRPSSKSVGSVACVIMVSVIFLIVASDAITFWGRAH